MTCPRRVPGAVRRSSAHAHRAMDRHGGGLAGDPQTSVAADRLHLLRETVVDPLAPVVRGVQSQAARSLPHHESLEDHGSRATTCRCSRPWSRRRGLRGAGLSRQGIAGTTGSSGSAAGGPPSERTGRRCGCRWAGRVSREPSRGQQVTYGVAEGAGVHRVQLTEQVGQALDPQLRKPHLVNLPVDPARKSEKHQQAATISAHQCTHTRCSSLTSTNPTTTRLPAARWTDRLRSCTGAGESSPRCPSCHSARRAHAPRPA